MMFNHNLLVIFGYEIWLSNLRFDISLQSLCMPSQLLLPTIERINKERSLSYDILCTFKIVSVFVLTLVRIMSQNCCICKSAFIVPIMYHNLVCSLTLCLNQGLYYGHVCKIQQNLNSRPNLSRRFLKKNKLNLKQIQTLNSS